MNDELENKELSDLLKQLPAPERLNAARRARIFAVLPSGKKDVQQAEREARRRIWHRIVKVAAIVVLMVGVLVGVVIPGFGLKRSASVQYCMAVGEAQVDRNQPHTSDFSISPGVGWSESSSAPLDSPVDDPPESFYVAQGSVDGDSGVANAIPIENRDASNVEALKKPSLKQDGDVRVYLDGIARNGYALGAVASPPVVSAPASAPAGSTRAYNKGGDPFSQAQVALDELSSREAEPLSPPPMSPKPAEMNSVAILKSPIVMRGIVGSRSPGQRGKALSSGGAKAEQQAGAVTESSTSDRQRKQYSKPDKAEVADIKNRLDKANEYYASGELAQSRKETELVLRDYPWYEDGVDMLSKVNTAEHKYVDHERLTNREQMMRDVTKESTSTTYEKDVQADEAPDAASAPSLTEKEEPEPSPPPSLDIGPFTLIPTAQHPLSTFGLDTDTAGYTRSAMLIASGVRPEPEQIRQEEFINAFEYGDTAPTEAAFRIYIEGARSPFRSANNLLRVGVKGRRLGREEKRSLMLTILLDTSGSMETPERMPLARKAILALLAKLPEGDSVTILTCSDKTRKLFSGSAWDNPETFRTAEKRVNEIRCQGATNLEDGIVRAFESAASEFKPHGENRVVIISDGIANLGSNNASEILKRVAENRGRGIRCSVIGVGRSSYNDTLLEAMANRGDGQYSFLDSEQSIDESFVSDLENSFNTIASDVKIQVEWNREVVEAYKSHGYDSRALRDEQFRDDTVDAGEVGSGQGVTVVYEMKLADSATASAILGTVRIRYRRTDTGVVEEIEKAITTADVMREFSTARPQFRLACAVAEFATVLKHTPAAAQASALKDVVAIADVVAWNLDYYQPAKAFAETVRKLMALGL